jgi:hypothetical protein
MALDNPSSPDRQTAFMSALVTEHFRAPNGGERDCHRSRTVRHVDTGIENQQFLRGIARIRGYLRTLTPEARVFSAGRGRWPEAHAAPPLWSGALVAFLTTAASMIAFINSIVAGTGVTLLANSLVGHDQIRLTVGLGVMATVILMAVFLAYQRRRYRDAEAAAPPEEAEPATVIPAEP